MTFQFDEKICLPRHFQTDQTKHTRNYVQLLAEHGHALHIGVVEHCSKGTPPRDYWGVVGWAGVASAHTGCSPLERSTFGGPGRGVRRQPVPPP